MTWARTIVHRRIAEYSVRNVRCEKLNEVLPLGEVCLTKFGWWQMRAHTDGAEFSITSTLPLDPQLSEHIVGILAHLDEWLRRSFDAMPRPDGDIVRLDINQLSLSSVIVHSLNRVELTFESRECDELAYWPSALFEGEELQKIVWEA